MDTKSSVLLIEPKKFKVVFWEKRRIENDIEAPNEETAELIAKAFRKKGVGSDKYFPELTYDLVEVKEVKRK